MCTSPLVGYPDGYTEKGKTHYHIVSYTEAKRNKFALPNQSGSQSVYGQPILIPCGKCLECKLEYAKKWSDRCMLELKDHDSSYFVTLTYDDEHLEKLKNDKGIPSLNKRDFQLFMKLLREKISHKEIYDENLKEFVPNPYYHPKGVRFYHVGEYGSKNGRPHEHVIIFGLFLFDLQFYKKNIHGDNLYNSPFLDSLWKKGFVVVGDVTPASCNYVARYVSKKASGFTKQHYEQLGILPEYTSMSLKPGIGFNSYTPDIFRKGYESIATEDGGIKVFPPRYFEKFYEKEFPHEFNSYKEHNKESSRSKMINLCQSSGLEYDEALERKELDLKLRTKCLVRNL